MQGNIEDENEIIGDITTSNLIINGNEELFVKINHTTQKNQNNENFYQFESFERKQPTRKDIVEIYMSRKSLIDQTINFGDDKVIIKVPEANGSAFSIINWGRTYGFDNEQQRAFEVFVSSFVLTFFKEAVQTVDEHNNRMFFQVQLELVKLCGLVKSNSLTNPNIIKQTIAFLHGPAGCGKSAVLCLLKNYAKQYCNLIGQKFGNETILFTAMTGLAATFIEGKTTHKALYLNTNIKDVNKNQMRMHWKATRMVIIDEVSFMSESDVKLIEKNLKILKDEHNQPYGGLNIIFVGDMKQLEPHRKSGELLYEKHIPVFHSLLNCYIELNGMRRFKGDEQYGAIMMRLRNGQLTENDISVLNSKVIKKETELPHDIQHVTYTNAYKATINIGIFEKYCKKKSIETGLTEVENAILIFGSDIKMQDGNNNYVTPEPSWEKWFFENYGEGQVETKKFYGRVDPCLMLYYDRPVMVNENLDVENGIANGTRARLIKIELKKNETPVSVNFKGINLKAIRANQMSKIILKHENKKIGTKYFNLKPKKQSFGIKMTHPNLCQTENKRGKNTYKMNMQMVQIPIIINNAMTGYKLQGQLINNLFVQCLNDERNWCYVVLSRIKTLKGLYLRKPLNKENINKYNETPDRLREMINDFKRDLLHKPFTQEEYLQIIGLNQFENLVSKIEH